jgi:hypothetical protein
MALICCEECNREISDKAISCPGCGAPIARRKPLSPPAKSPPTPTPIEDVLKHVNRQSTPGYVKTANGIGTTFGGYVAIPGHSNLGFVKYYFCILYIPIYPVGTYLVTDWDGNGGRFIGEISPENARRFVSTSKQAAALMLSTVMKLVVVIIAIYLFGLLMYALHK